MDYENLIKELESLPNTQASIDCISNDLRSKRHKFKPIPTYLLYTILSEEEDYFELSDNEYYTFDIEQHFAKDLDYVLEYIIEDSDNTKILESFLELISSYAPDQRLNEIRTRLNERIQLNRELSFDILYKYIDDEDKFIESFCEKNKDWVYDNIEAGGLMTNVHVFTFTATDGHAFSFYTDYLGEEADLYPDA